MNWHVISKDYSTRLQRGLPAAVRDSELRFHSLPERVALQLKFLPKGTFVETISKARELCLIYNRADATSTAKHIHNVTESSNPRLDRMEATIQSLFEQLLALNTHQKKSVHHLFYLWETRPHCKELQDTGNSTCFKCGNRGHLAAGKREREQGNGRGSIQNE